ncbi:MAG: S8 family serine peptidase [Sphingobacteriales bacterium]|nr:S8 family serine peptidase [Sphingobacteriales bacterium]
MKYLSIVILTFCLLLSVTLEAQVNTGSNKIYRVSFKDKKNTPYSVNRPLEFLSQRAIDRRIRFGIPVDESDFPVNPAYLDSLRKAGAQILFTSRWMNSATIKVDTITVIRQIRQYAFVTEAVKVFSSTDSERVDVLPYPVTDTETAGLNYGHAFRQINMLNGDFLHEKGFQGQGVVIAVNDAGFWKVDRLSLFKNMFDENRVKMHVNLIRGDDSVFKDHTHGTYVLSVMAANIPGFMIGTAPKAEYILIVSENGSNEYPVEEEAWISATEIADSAGADIINSSLGYSEFDNPAMNHTYNELDGNTLRISRAADIAASKGLVVVSSAGNQGSKEWKYITAPADADSILTVGAVNAKNEYAPFSSTGPSADGDVKPNVVAMGWGTVAASLEDNKLELISGTSLSAPVITGLTACLIQAFPNKNNMEIIRAIEQSAHLYPFPDHLMGYGIPDYKLAYEILSLSQTPSDKTISLLKIYPNPFKNGLNISFFSKEKSTVSITLYNLIGKKINEYSTEVNANSFNREIFKINGILRPGFYFLELNDGKTKVRERLVAY